MLKHRTIYWVSPDGDNRWQVKREGDGDVLFHLPTKRDAVIFAHKIATGNPPSQLCVQRKDGTIEEEFTCGDDPYPPKG